MDETLFGRTLTISLTEPNCQPRTGVMDIDCATVAESKIYSAFVDDDSVGSMVLHGTDGTVVNISKQRIPDEPTNLIVFRKKITLE